MANADFDDDDFPLDVAAIEEHLGFLQDLVSRKKKKLKLGAVGPSSPDDYLGEMLEGYEEAAREDEEAGYDYSGRAGWRDFGEGRF